MVAAYRRIIKMTMFVTCVTVISMGAVAEPLIYCMIGPQWHEAATFLPYICFIMSTYPLQAINLNMLQVQGRSDIFLYLEIIKKIIALGPLVIGIFFNIYYMLIASIVASIISYFLNSYYTGKKLNYNSWMQLKDVSGDYGIAFGVAISVFFLKYLPISYWLILPLQIILGIIVFFIICESTKLDEYLELKGMVMSAIKKYKK